MLSNLCLAHVAWHLYARILPATGATCAGSASVLACRCAAAGLPVLQAFGCYAPIPQAKCHTMY
jgi:hypothetical protein